MALREKLSADAKERQRASGGDKKSERAKSVVEPVPQPIAEEPAKTRDQIGKLVGVTGRTIQDAVKVIEKGVLVHARAADKYVNATALCEAGKRRWSNYAANLEFKRFRAKLSQTSGIPEVQLVETRRGNGGGTWVHPQLAIRLCMWISGEFAAQVTDWIQTPFIAPSP